MRWSSSQFHGPTRKGSATLLEAEALEKKPAAPQALATRVLEGDGRASRAERRAAFDNTTPTEPLRGLISKVANHPTRVTEDDIAAVKASGLSEDQIFELTVAAAYGAARLRLDRAMDAMAALSSSAEASREGGGS